MTRFTYASAITPLTPQVVISSGNLTIAFSGKLYLQKRTRQGFTLFSSFASFSANSGQRVEVTIPSLTRKAADDIRSFVLSYSSTGNYIDAAVIATYLAIDPITKENTDLPFTFYLDRDEHLQVGKTAINLSALPTGNNRIHGMRRFLDSENKIVEWDAINDTWSIASPQSFSTFVEVSTAENGCDRDIGLIEERSILIPEAYAIGEASTPVKYWLVNDSGSQIPKGTPIATIISCPNYNFGQTVLNPEDENRRAAGDISRTISEINGATIKLLGYANTITGELDTTGENNIGIMSGFNQANPYKTEPNSVVLPKDLLDKWAYVYEISFNFSLTALKLSAGAQLTVTSDFYPFAGQYSVLAKSLGNLIAPTEGRRRIVPKKGLSAIALSGSGSINGYSFYKAPSSTVVGLTGNNGNQLIAISGSGACLNLSAIPENMALRAIISTANGVGQATSWSSLIALNGSQKISVLVDYPTNIRDNYPDIIAGSSEGEFNASSVRFYVKNESTQETLYWQSAISPDTLSEAFEFGSINDSASGFLPTASSDFGLYEISSFTSSVGSAATGVLLAGSYRIAIALVYNNTVTSISHSPQLGCIGELKNTLDSLERYGRSWADILRNSDLELISQIEIIPFQYRKVLETGSLYQFNPKSLVGRKPTWIPVDKPGRWELVKSGTWFNTIGTPSINLGFDGDWSVESSTGNFWYKIDGEWVLQGSLRSTVSALHPCGAWNPLITYSPPDLVTYQGSSWLALQSSTAVSPAENSFWQLIAGKGTQGNAGVNGGNLGTIQTVQFTTGLLDPQQVVELTVNVGILARIRKVSTNSPIWMRIYGSVTGRVLDASRPMGANAPRQIGLALDIETSSSLNQTCQNVWFDNLDATPSGNAYFSITNLANYTASITIILEIIKAA